MIGLPLRLLAREVYDRLRAEKGDDAVALVTGEEKRVPPGARYFACTVEAMPLDRATDVVVVDEVQLATHRTRGHVFTDRILHARGLRHTMFLGSDTMAPLLEEMVPSIQISSQTRLSALTHSEPRKLTSLPKRSAVIGFSVARVYDLAERLKARHGGAAVVLGALSPRARNAQVAMYQSGEVPYLVATDAIGMGLNLDVDHVAFSDTRKWDGRSQRELSPAELAQIAGRAGRFTRDGTFSTLTETEPLSPSVIHAIENHTFRPVDEVWWRESELDFDSLDGLLASLVRPARRPYLRRMRDADDHQALQQLAGVDAVRLRATSLERVQLLWEVSQVPDFRKTLTDSHTELLARIYVQLVDHGRLSDHWVEGRVDRLDNVNGDLDALMTRIAWVRTWSYLSQRRSWFSDGPAWQAKCRAIEESLSDAVHEALTRRFVERRLRLRLADLSSVVRLDNDAVVVDEEIVGVVRGLSYTPMTGIKLAGEVRAEVIARIASLATACSVAPDSDFGLSAEHALLWDDRVVGRFEAGDDWRSPKLRVARTVDLSVAL
ncbi:MAG: ATP-dependent RNA helicase SUPV3L1/SUV3, partial [bacterium]